jgi:hypothetical protein
MRFSSLEPEISELLNIINSAGKFDTNKPLDLVAFVEDRKDEYVGPPIISIVKFEPKNTGFTYEHLLDIYKIQGQVPDAYDVTCKSISGVYINIKEGTLYMPSECKAVHLTNQNIVRTLLEKLVGGYGFSLGENKRAEEKLKLLYVPANTPVIAKISVIEQSKKIELGKFEAAKAVIDALHTDKVNANDLVKWLEKK